MNKKTVLIAGNDKAWSRTLAAPLLREGYEIIESPDNLSALQAWQKARPDLLVLGPPQGGVGDGLDLLGEIRRRENGLSLVLINPHRAEDNASLDSHGGKWT